MYINIYTLDLQGQRSKKKRFFLSHSSRMCSSLLFIAKEFTLRGYYKADKRSF